MMENIMNAVNAVMSVCRDSLDDADDDYERVTILLSIIYNIARLAGEQGVPRRQIAHDVLGAVAAGHRVGATGTTLGRAAH